MPPASCPPSRSLAMPTYLAYGLTIQSALRLPEFLPTGDLEKPADVTLDVHTDPAQYHRAAQLAPIDRNWTLEVNRSQATVFLRDAGLFQITEGRSIQLTLAPGVEESLLRLYLGGVVMAILLYQRNCLVLHASAVMIADRAVGFLGVSGAGKSSIAVALEKRGHPIITDDVLALQFIGNAVYAAPGYPQVKLTPESALTLGHNLSHLLPLHQVETKLGYRIKASFPTAPMPLQALYFLGIGEHLSITPAAPQTSTIELIPFSAPTRWHLPGDSQHLMQCVNLSRQTPIFDLQRPRDLTRLEESAQFVEDHILQSIWSAAS